MAQHSESGVMRVGADLDITRGENTYSVVPALLYTPEGQRPEVATFPAEANTNAEVKINQIDADQKIIELVFEGIAEEPPATAAPADQLLVDVSKKPFMNLLWLGTILIIVGTMISIKRRLTPAAQG
jgi:cytochrome c-type biogenesis protein CcmF